MTDFTGRRYAGPPERYETAKLPKISRRTHSPFPTGLMHNQPVELHSLKKHSQMKTAIAIGLMVTINACQYRELGMTVTPPKGVTLQEGCLAKTKTVQTLTDQLGTIIYAEKLAFISLPSPNTDQPHYWACNIPEGLRNGQKVRFSARVKYQPEIVNGAVIDYMGQAIELTQLTLL